ncbi:6-phosphogluconate dehydrogenase C-terminal domain-like protein [Xylariaceae sp. FL1272]|nr:6-phosphogluconate dehydrogenase C-terminal domain-like protein [Xylariaceae sp. FL1272]
MGKTVGILSIGEMGLGIAQVLQFHGYRVVTNVSDRSQATQARAREHNIDNLPTDVELVRQCDFILSIVPPRDALATAERINAAATGCDTKKTHFLDLNAVSPSSSKATYDLFEKSPNVVLYDGVISGGVPYPKEKDEKTGQPTRWHCPTLLMSGPSRVEDPELCNALNIEHLGDKIGAAAAVKMCFGMVSKGYIALAIQSFTTAYRLGVLEDLEAFLGRYKPQHLQIAREGLVRMPHTAYRWVHEMLEMADTTSEYGGFNRTLFEGVAESYRVVAEDTVLGTELPDKRVRGMTVEDVVECVSEGIDRVSKT